MQNGLVDVPGAGQRNCDVEIQAIVARAALQGFPEDFVLPAAKTQAYRQFGNAVAVPVVSRLAEEILRQSEDDAPVENMRYEPAGGDEALPC